MKKLFVLLLAVLVLSSVAMVAVACEGDDETTTTTATEVTTAPGEATTTVAGSTALTPAEAKVIGDGIVAEYKAAGEGAKMEDYVEADVTFAGPVLSISEKADKYIVSIGTAEASYPICFYKADLEGLALTADILNAWVGQNVEVSGDVVLNPFGSATEIVIKDAAQVVMK